MKQVYEIRTYKQYDHDVKLAVRRGLDIEKLLEVVSPMPNGYTLLDASITMPRDSISSAYQTSWRLIINTRYSKTCQL